MLAAVLSGSLYTAHWGNEVYMRMLRINWGSIAAIGEWIFTSLSRLSFYWPFSWRGLSAIILGVLLAKWVWVLFAPHAIFTANIPERASSQELGQLFGVTLTTEVASQGVALPNVQLLGVFAASAGKPGFAILKLDNTRQMGLAVGEEIVAGAKLIDVRADHVLIERAGVQQRVNLENKFPGSPNTAVLPEYGSATQPTPDNDVPGKNTTIRTRQLRR